MTGKYSLLSVPFDPFAGHEIEKVVVTNESQRELWLSCILGGEDASLAYNESVSLTLEGELNHSAFKEALKLLALRHEALRAVLSPNGEQLIIYKDLTPELLEYDIQEFSDVAWRNKVNEFIETATSLRKAINNLKQITKPTTDDLFCLIFITYFTKGLLTFD